MCIIDDPRLTPCNHAFCKECLERMLRVKQKSDVDCPICKMHLNKRSLRRLESLCNLSSAFKRLADVFERETGRTWDDPIEGDAVPVEMDPADDHIRTLNRSSSVSVRVLKEVTPIAKRRAIVSSDLPPSKHDTSTYERLKELESSAANQIMEIDRQLTKKGIYFTLPETDALDQLCHLNFPSSPQDDLFLTLTQPIVEKSQPNRLVRHPEIVLATSLLSKSQVTTVKRFCELFGIALRETYSPQVTHLIAACSNFIARRSFKYLSAALEGKWIVTYEWIEQCLLTNELLDAEEYEVLGDDHFPDEEGPRRARISREHDESPLFRGISIYLYGEFSAPTKDELAALISLGGGRLVEGIDGLKKGFQRITPPSPSPTSRSVVVICDPKEQTNFEMYAAVISKYRPLLTSSWLLDCISAYQILDRRDYIVL